MLPDDVKLLNPIDAGCWHCVAAMTHGLLVLCGPTVPAATWLNVMSAAEALPASAKTIIPAIIRIPNLPILIVSPRRPAYFVAISRRT